MKRMKSPADLATERHARFSLPHEPQAVLGLAAAVDYRRHDGIDVSHYQGDVNWKVVAPHLFARTPEPFAACKATQGKTFVDRTLMRNRLGMRDAGLPIRFFYHWLNPAPLAVRMLASARRLDAEAQARHMLATVGALSRGEGIMLDAEQDGITADQALAFCEYIEARTGRPVAVYTGRYVAGGTIWNSAAIFNGRRARIFAAYTTTARATTLAAPHGWDVWQWTGSGTVPGVGPLVDINSVASTTRLRAACGITAAPPAPVPPPPAPQPEPPITQEKLVNLIAYAYAGDTAVFVTDGLTSRWVPNRTALDRLIWSSTAQKHPLLDVNGDPVTSVNDVPRIPTGDAGGFGHIVGPMPPNPTGKTRDAYGCPR